jgi:ABC-type transport system involved in multi-copper enzyme maturation permease subunit
MGRIKTPIEKRMENRKMKEIIRLTLKGIFRDRIFQGIMALAILFLGIPSAASLSMRQVTELSTTLSLSLISFILLLLSVFLGATSIWKDMERRYTFSVLSLPISRGGYMVGRFLGISLFILLTSATLGAVACCVIKIASMGHPPSRPIAWDIIATTILFDGLKYIIVVAVAMLVSSVSTSFFLPVFGTIAIFLSGTITQQVYDFIHSPSGSKEINPLMQKLAMMVYYILPNLSGFDLKVNAIYSIPLSPKGMALSLGYFISYCTIVLFAAAILFARREMK